MENSIGGRWKHAIGLLSALLLLFFYPTSALAQVKIALSSITKWEVIGSYSVVGYTGETPYIIVRFTPSIECTSLSVGSRFVLRTFSPSIQILDTVIVNSSQCYVSNIRLIRQD
jgi:hypothetical protein